jgi:hypothetical protein
MMTPIFYAHRTNTIADLEDLPLDIGVEIDLRDINQKLYLSHDPFVSAELLLEFSPNYIKMLESRPLIINVKSERIESQINQLLVDSCYAGNFFFLDSSFSVISSLGKSLPFASRLSEFEPLELSKRLFEASLITWVWIDTFSCLPLDQSITSFLTNSSIKTCLTSPDLLGRPHDIVPYFDMMKSLSFVPTAICCKKHNISLWSALFASLNF